MKISLLFLFLLGSTNIWGQDHRKEFETFKRRQVDQFDQFKTNNDSLFASFISESWKKMNLLEPMNSFKQKGPAFAPIFNSEILKDSTFFGLPEDTAIVMRTFQPEPYESPNFFPETIDSKFNFFGANLTVRYSKDFFDIPIQGTGRNAMIDFWLNSGKKGYQPMLEDLLEYRDELQLPDFGFYLLVKSVVSQLCTSSDHVWFYTWFILNKSNMACKLGFDNNGPVILLASYGKIYGCPFFKENDFYFYAVEGTSGELYSYGNPSMLDLKAFDFSIRETIKLPLKATSKNITVEYLGTRKTYEIWSNENITQMLGQFVSVDIRYYLQSTSGLIMMKSLQKAFDPILTKMSQVERAKFLLNLVQQGFQYQTDQMQFGVEKIMFPDEFVHFDYSDCDDRVVYLAYLLKLFTDLEIIAVLFPQHVALAVHLPGHTYGESVLFEGRKYTFCDPTYFNAPLGAVIPDADKSKARILRVLR